MILLALAIIALALVILFAVTRHEWDWGARLGRTVGTFLVASALIVLAAAAVLGVLIGADVLFP